MRVLTLRGCEISGTEIVMHITWCLQFVNFELVKARTNIMTQRIFQTQSSLFKAVILDNLTKKKIYSEKRTPLYAEHVKD